MNLAVIDCSGVGYEVNTSQNTLGKIEKGKATTLFTHLHVREDVFDIYGFADREELATFRMLLSVSGVGPKAALSILSGATPERIALGVISGDEKIFTKAPGIGKRIAQRVILELKDKLKKEQFTTGAGEIPADGLVAGGASEAVSALMVLGYSQSEAYEAILPFKKDGLSTEELIRKALQSMVR
jgi:Holliday junction DNA helicase RuvA